MLVVNAARSVFSHAEFDVCLFTVMPRWTAALAIRQILLQAPIIPVVYKMARISLLRASLLPTASNFLHSCNFLLKSHGLSLCLLLATAIKFEKREIGPH
jgi:hypothetical protein